MIPLTRYMLGAVESCFIFPVVSRDVLIVVACIPQQVCDMLAEIGME
jgi:hypothetical protein